MNVITIAGRIGREPELRHTQSGDPVLSFSVADDQGKDKPAQWWRASLWGKRAQALQPHLHKGDHVTIVGPVSQREYTDKSGVRQMSLDVRVQEIALQGGRPAGVAPAPTPRPAPAPAPAHGGFDDMDDDIPF